MKLTINSRWLAISLFALWAAGALVAAINQVWPGAVICLLGLLATLLIASALRSRSQRSMYPH